MFYFIICVWYFACMSVDLHAWYPLKPEEDSWTWNYRWLWAICGCWMSHPGPLDEQPVLLTAEPSSSPTLMSFSVSQVWHRNSHELKEAMLYSACWLFLLIFQFLRMFLMITPLVLQYENFGSGGAHAPIAQWLYMLGLQACVGDSAPCWYPKGGNSLLLRFLPILHCY